MLAGTFSYITYSYLDEKGEEKTEPKFFSPCHHAHFMSTDKVVGWLKNHYKENLCSISLVTHLYTRETPL